MDTEAHDLLPETVDLDVLSDSELELLAKELDHKLHQITAENLVFEAFFNRMLPGSGGLLNEGDGAAQSLEQGAPGGNASSGKKDEDPEAKVNNRNNALNKKKKGEKNKESDRPVLLSMDEKNEIALREMEELRDDVQKRKEDWARVLDNYKAELEEIDIRTVELKKLVYEFKRDIVSAALNPRTGKIMAEKLVRYYEEQVKDKDAIIEKIRLKNATLKAQKNKLVLQLKQKEEMGDILHAIDFDQLQIENKQYLAKIEERNAELIKLKVTAGNTIQNLNHHRKRLQSLMKDSEHLKVDITLRRDLLAKLETESDIVATDLDKAQKQNLKLQTQMDEYTVPSVIDYVVLKAQESELSKASRNWQRKVEIASHETQKVRKTWNKMQQNAEHRAIQRLPSPASTMGFMTPKQSAASQIPALPRLRGSSFD